MTTRDRKYLRYAPEEDAIVLRYVGMLSAEQIARMIPGRSASSVTSRMDALGIRPISDGAHRVVEPYEYRRMRNRGKQPPDLPVGGSLFIRPLTRAELMAGRALPIRHRHSELGDDD